MSGVGEPFDEIAFRCHEMQVDVQLEYAVEPPDDSMYGCRSFVHPDDGWVLLGCFDESGPVRIEWAAEGVRPCSRWLADDSSTP